MVGVVSSCKVGAAGKLRDDDTDEALVAAEFVRSSCRRRVPRGRIGCCRGCCGIRLRCCHPGILRAQNGFKDQHYRENKAEKTGRAEAFHFSPLGMLSAPWSGTGYILFPFFDASHCKRLRTFHLNTQNPDCNQGEDGAGVQAGSFQPHPRSQTLKPGMQRYGYCCVMVNGVESPARLSVPVKTHLPDVF